MAGLKIKQRARAAFTLVEVAVAILIVGIALTLVLQSLNTSKLRAKQTQNLKLARELGTLTMGRLSAGLYREDIDSYYTGSYSEEGYPEFSYEIVLGDNSFPELEDYEEGVRFDSWYDEDLNEEDDDEDAEEPYEKIRIRVTFPVLSEYSNQLELERWIPWDQVYGEDEDDALEGDTP
jgi:prepilin-type N-terminal cleavage/methylation domain-containing protein